MLDAFKQLLKQPYWGIALVIGALLIALPCVTVDKDNHFSSHPPSSIWPVACGLAMLCLSAVAFGFALWSKRSGDVGAGLDLTRVKRHNGTFSTNVSGCEISVVNGRIEDYAQDQSTAVVLPCNEYFDDRCVSDTRSALGAYVNRVFEGQVPAFVSLVKDECRRQLGVGKEQQKTRDERAESFGPGRCLLLMKPLERSVPIALVSTTTQRAGEGLAARISYLFDGMHELVTRLADARLTEAAMPILAAGHGGIDPPLAFVGLLLRLQRLRATVKEPSD